MEEIFRYKFDRRSKRITAAVIVAVTAALCVILWFGVGGYLSAWFLFFVLAVAALYILSIPRYVKVDDEAFEIHCVVELTRIHIGDVKSAVRLDADAMRYAFPLLGSYGFFGYYGYYYDLREWQTIKVYAKRWDDFVQVEDIYEQKYVVSCPDPDALVAAVNRARKRYLNRDFREQERRP